MAGLIVKSPYVKCGGSQNAGGYLRYIATRERVELIPDVRPQTRKQAQLIEKLMRDFPSVQKLDEYASYMEQPTKANASVLITMALEENWSQVQRSEGYAKYIATRPRAERLGEHGLFGDEDSVGLDRAMEELEHYTGNVWTHILSLTREDAERLGCNNAQAWRALLRANRNTIAAAMNIRPENFRWYAAFHDEGDHPHCHMMAWSTIPGQAYLSKDGIRRIRSTLTDQIFRQEMLHIYERKSVSRDELVQQSRKALLELSRQMRSSICDQPETERLMQDLSMELKMVHGKKSYGYLPKRVKKIVDEIVDQMERLPVVSECYDQWWQLQCQVDDFYSEQERKRPKLSEQKEFRSIKNAVIKEAEHIRMGTISFENQELGQEDERFDDRQLSYDYWDCWDAISNEDTPLADRDYAANSLMELAEGGDAYAQYFMGKLYRDGPLLTPDWRKARYYFELAAEHGLTAAQYNLGKLLLSDDTEVRDIDDGIHWLKQAAQNGSDYAAYRMGKEYLRDEFVEKNAEKAVSYFTQAAEMGNQYGQYMLGKLYLDGVDVEQDRERAKYWFNRSAAQGNQYAQFFLDRWETLWPTSVMTSAIRLLHRMSQISRDTAPTPAVPGGIQIDRKRLRQLREKKIAMGHKADDHEEHSRGGMTMRGW